MADRHSQRWLVLLLIVLSALLGTPRLPRAQAQDDASWLLGQVNGLRAGLGLAPYALNAALNAAAYQHSQYMVNTCDVSHSEADGSTPASRALANGYGGSFVTENIYMGGNARATDAWNFWSNSAVHYAGLTNPNANEIGIGVAHGSCGHGFTLLFGRAGGSPPAAPAGGAAAPAAPPPPTQRPYIPPTPTPTYPTLVPSATWTITPSRTPSPSPLPPTATIPAPTQTPLLLPTLPAATRTPIVVAQLPTATPTATASPSPSATPSATPLPVALPAPTAEDASVPGWLVGALLGAAAILAAAGIGVWRLARR